MKVCLKASDLTHLYLIVFKKCYEHFYIYRVQFEDLIDKYTFLDMHLVSKIECEGLK